MLNPREAAEDSLTLNIAILFFAAVAVLISIYLHHDTALKYWLLHGFGKTTQGTILSVDRINGDLTKFEQTIRSNKRNSLKNFDALVSGSTIFVEFKPEDEPVEILAFTMPAVFVGSQKSNLIDISYLPINPRIAYPADYLSNFAFDSKIVQWSLVIGLGIVWLGVLGIQKWMGFRRHMRRY